MRADIEKGKSRGFIAREQWWLAVLPAWLALLLTRGAVLDMALGRGRRRRRRGWVCDQCVGNVCYAQVWALAAGTPARSVPVPKCQHLHLSHLHLCFPCPAFAPSCFSSSRARPAAALPPQGSVCCVLAPVPRHVALASPGASRVLLPILGQPLHTLAALGTPLGTAHACAHLRSRRRAQAARPALPCAFPGAQAARQ